MIQDYVALDVETTGLNPARDRLLEIGAAKIRNGKVEGTFQTFIDAGVEVPERITELTGITDAMRLGGKRLEQAIPEFLEFCEDLPILGHNVSFDFGFLKQASVNQGLSFERHAVDTLKIARKLLPDLPSRRLPDLCTYYQIDPGNSHRALDDALSAHFLLWKLWEAFGETAPDEFSLHPLVYSAKKQGPIAKSQKAYLNDLMKYHRIETSIRIDDLTRSEASRMIDKIILQYGRIPGRERKERERK